MTKKTPKTTVDTKTTAATTTTATTTATKTTTNKKKWEKPTLEEVSDKVMAQPYIRFT
ncbi:MAG: hypothetical protein HY747_08260 [Elusimicrobia bacterium]|nr:hypothetical protein [Elusimicrobiota bacterium]